MSSLNARRTEIVDMASAAGFRDQYLSPLTPDWMRCAFRSLPMTQYVRIATALACLENRS